MTKRRRDREPAHAPSEPGTVIPAFELRYTSDAAADIKNQDGEVVITYEATRMLAGKSK